MDEIWKIVLVSGFFSGLFAVITALIVGLWYGNELHRAKMAGISPLGVQKRLEKAERMDAALLRVGQLMQAEPKPEWGTVIKTIAAEYPDVAMDLAKKGFKYVQKDLKSLSV